MKKVLIFLLAFVCLMASRVFATGTIDINAASSAQLDTLTGIGPVYAQRIIDGRPYSSVDDLLRVSGIGPKTLQKIKDQGLACVNCGQTQQPAQQTSQTTPLAQSPATTPTEATNEQSNDAPPLTATPALTPTAASYPSGVFINELLPNPEGADETNEWIELYNSDSFDVDLSDWQLQDVAGTITTYTITQNTKILAGGFLVFKRPDTKIMLNNDEDGINLLTPDKKVVDSVSFNKAPLGQSYNKAPSGWSWSTTPTPGTKNIITAVMAQVSNKTLSKSKNSVKNNSVEPGLADLSQTLDNNQENTSGNPWFLFFMVLATTMVLAAAVLFIKLKIFKNHVRT